MHYYVWKAESGEPIGWHETKHPYHNPTAIEVTKEEYIKLGGSPKKEENQDPVTKEEEKIQTLEKENKLLKAQIQAQSDRADFIEDCIAEMAIQVYN